MAVFSCINLILSLLFFLAVSYKFIFLLFPLFQKPKSFEKARAKRYAIVIPARNEEGVIGHLLDSIREQDYPKECLDAYVIADNCTDSTAETAERHGAKVYRRTDKHLVGKGYALDSFFHWLKSEQSLHTYEGFFIIDADNLLSTDYVSCMNDAFCSGYDIVTSRRNSKNFGSGWVASANSLWFLWESTFLNSVRCQLGTCCAVSGTGFLFSAEIIEENGGWPYHLLTEDIEFTVCERMKGKQIGYCAKAEFFDEQPVSFAQSFRQRTRWAKGILQIFFRYGLAMIRRIPSSDWFSFLDLSLTVFGTTLLSVVMSAVSLASGIYQLAVLGHVETGMLFLSTIFTYLIFASAAAYVVSFEWKSIHASRKAKILSVFTFPIFMFSYLPIALYAFFTKVEWKPICHGECKSLSQVTGGR